MGQNNQILMHLTDNTGSQAGNVVLLPVRDRNGIYEYSGNLINGDPDILVNTVDTRVTASVRPGVPADFILGKQRVKRRCTLKVALPISVPAAVGTTVDYINVDFVLSAPVSSTEAQIRTALTAISTVCFDGAASPLKDLVVNGREPY